MSCGKGGFYDPEDGLTTYDIPHTDDDEVCGTCMNWDSGSWTCDYDRADEGEKTELSPNDYCVFDHWHHR